MNQRLVRFDVRLHKDEYVSSHWSKKDRDLFLLRPEIEWPLSIDPLVWPSIFDSKIFRVANKLPYPYIEVDPSLDGGHYWLNLELMQAHFKAHKQPGMGGVFVALDLFSEKELDSDYIPYMDIENNQCALELGITAPPQCPSGSIFLGFDVADASRISGLTNCEYSAEDKEQLLPRWTSRLNSFGLLKTLGDAVEFRSVCDSRIEDHAPFWIYGISRLPYS